MTIYRDGMAVPQTFFEAAALHWSVRVRCGRCTQAAVFEAAGVWWRCHRKGWSDRFADARRHFYCVGCTRHTGLAVRPASIEAVAEPPAKFLDPPPDREWKRAARRFRM